MDQPFVEKINNLNSKFVLNFRLLKTIYTILEFIKNIMPLFVHHTRSTQIELKEGWGNILSPGDYVSNHDHRSAEISGVLYFTEGEPIYFPQYDIHIKPTPGKFLLFHSMVSHSVPTNQSQQERYSLAFNFYSVFDHGKYTR